MYSLPGPSGEDEPSTPEPEPESTVDLEELWTWYVRAVVLGSMAVTLYRMMSDDDIRLHVFHGASRLLGRIAFLFGAASLASEKAYYKIVDRIPH
jgi:hypothetical protein